MAVEKSTSNSSILVFLFISILIGYGAQASHSDYILLKMEQRSQVKSLTKGDIWRWSVKSARRLMIGSIAPTCTYNECRGCRFKCSSEQVPVDANDPMNSAYHYRCLCHR